MADADPAAAFFNVSRQLQDLLPLEGKVVLQSPTTGHKIKVKIEQPKKKFLQTFKGAFKTKAAAENPVNDQPAEYYEEIVPTVSPTAPGAPQNRKLPALPVPGPDPGTGSTFKTKAAAENPVNDQPVEYYEVLAPPVPLRAPRVPQNRKRPALPVPGPDPGACDKPRPIIPELPKLPDVVRESNDGACDAAEYAYATDYDLESTGCGGSNGASGASGDDDTYDDTYDDTVSWDKDIYDAVSESPDQLNSTGTSPDDDVYSKEFEEVYSNLSLQYLQDSVQKNKEADHKGASSPIANTPDEGRKSPDYVTAYV